MYAHLTTLYLCPNKMDEVIHIYKQEIIPFVQRQEGCQLITLLVDPDSRSDHRHRLVGERGRVAGESTRDPVPATSGATQPNPACYTALHLLPSEPTGSSHLKSYIPLS